MESFSEIRSGGGVDDQVEVMRADRMERAAMALSFIAIVSVWITRSENMDGHLL